MSIHLLIKETHGTSLKTNKNKDLVSKVCQVIAPDSIFNGVSYSISTTALLPIIAGYQLPPVRIQTDITCQIVQVCIHKVFPSPINMVSSFYVTSTHI